MTTNVLPFVDPATIKRQEALRWALLVWTHYQRSGVIDARGISLARDSLIMEPAKALVCYRAIGRSLGLRAIE